MTGNPHTWKEFYFPIYSFSLCNTALFGSFTLAYPASISTTSRCLTVPMQIFNHIAGWIPLECPDSDASGHTQLCWLDKVHHLSLLSKVVGSLATLSILRVLSFFTRSVVIALTARFAAARERTSLVGKSLGSHVVCVC